MPSSARLSSGAKTWRFETLEALTEVVQRLL
jgi:hypothetical protein